MKQIKYKVPVLICLIAVFCSCRKSDSLPVGRVMPRSIVNVEGRSVEISYTPGHSVPVVMIAGHGSEMQSWEAMYQRLEKGTTVFSYNRPGIGASETMPGPRDAVTIAREMSTMLEAAKLPAPYVLVAHSMGGIYARMFYHYYPQKVKGLVLIDATHEDQLDSLLQLIPLPARDLIYENMLSQQDSILNSLPEGPYKEEFRANFRTNYEQVRNTYPITSIPVCVLTSVKVDQEQPPFIIELKRKLHWQWVQQAGLNGRFIETDRSGHLIQEEEPALVAEAIKWAMNK